MDDEKLASDFCREHGIDYGDNIIEVPLTELLSRVRKEEREKAAAIVEKMRLDCDCEIGKFCESFGCSSLRRLHSQILGKKLPKE